MRVPEVMKEAMVEALVDELGLETTLNVLERARELDAADHPVDMNPDFIGMSMYAKQYAHEGRL